MATAAQCQMIQDILVHQLNIRIAQFDSAIWVSAMNGKQQKETVLAFNENYNNGCHNVIMKFRFGLFAIGYFVDIYTEDTSITVDSIPMGYKHLSSLKVRIMPQIFS